MRKMTTIALQKRSPSCHHPNWWICCPWTTPHKCTLPWTSCSSAPGTRRVTWDCGVSPRKVVLQMPRKRRTMATRYTCSSTIPEPPPACNGHGTAKRLISTSYDGTCSMLHATTEQVSGVFAAYDDDKAYANTPGLSSGIASRVRYFRARKHVETTCGRNL